MLDLAFAMAPPPEGGDPGGGEFARVIATDDHDVHDLLFCSHPSAKEKTG